LTSTEMLVTILFIGMVEARIVKESVTGYTSVGWWLVNTSL
ncbi:unnamed protein product, partial [marine sediment metagenome]